MDVQRSFDPSILERQVTAAADIHECKVTGCNQPFPDLDRDCVASHLLPGVHEHINHGTVVPPRPEDFSKHVANWHCRHELLFPLCAQHPNSNLDGHQKEQQLKEAHQVF